MVRGIRQLSSLAICLLGTCLFCLFAFVTSAYAQGGGGSYKYRPNRFKLRKVSPAEAAVLAQSNILNTGFGILDVTGPFLNVLSLFTINLRQIVIPYLQQKKLGLKVTEVEAIIDVFEAVREELMLTIPDVTNQNVNADFQETTVNRIINLAKVIDDLLYQLFYKKTFKWQDHYSGYFKKRPLIKPLKIQLLNKEAEIPISESTPEFIALLDKEAFKEFDQMLLHLRALIALAFNQVKGVNAPGGYNVGWGTSLHRQWINYPPETW